MHQFKADVEAGIVPVTVLFDALEKLTSAGGRFADMNERVSKTVAGRWNALVGVLEMAGRRIGKGLLEHFDVSGTLGERIESYSRMDGWGWAR